MLGLGNSIVATHDGITRVFNTTTNTKSLEFTGYSTGTSNPDSLTIDDDDLLRDPDYYCREALQFQDHSQLGGG